MNLKETLYVLLLVGLMSLVGNFVGFKNGILESLPGMLILIAISMGGILLGKYMPGGIFPSYCKNQTACKFCI